MNFSIAQLMKHKGALLAGVLAGLAAPGTIGASVEYPRPQGSDLKRLRGDVNRVGRDFLTVINREDGHQKSADQKRATD